MRQRAVRWGGGGDGIPGGAVDDVASGLGSGLGIGPEVGREVGRYVVLLVHVRSLKEHVKIMRSSHSPSEGGSS